MKPKKYLKIFLFNLLALWLATFLFEGVSFAGGAKTLVLAALVLTLVNLIIKPLIKLLFLPINLITLGAFRWLVNVIALYLMTFVVSQFQITGFVFSGYSYQGFIIPAFTLGIFLAYVVCSFFISLVTTFLLWLTK